MPLREKINTSKLKREDIGTIALKIIKYSLMFSFILWLAIIGWNSYKAYKAIQNLKNQQRAQLQLLKKKEQLANKYQSKLDDIRLAYKEISKVISPKNVRALLQELDSYVINMEERKKHTVIYTFNPYRISGFNIQLAIKLPSYIRSVSIAGVYIKSGAVENFKEVLDDILTNWNKKLYQPYIYANVEVVAKKNQILLYLREGNSTTSFLKLKPLILYGVINNVLKIPYFLTSTTINTVDLSLAPISQIFIGWDLQFKKTKGGLR